MRVNMNILRFGVLAAALVCTGIGAALGQHLEVLRKAVMICLECIGIG